MSILITWLIGGVVVAVLFCAVVTADKQRERTADDEMWIRDINQWKARANQRRQALQK